MKELDTMILFHQTMDEDEILVTHPSNPMVKFPLSWHQMMEIVFDHHPMAKILPSDGGKILPLNGEDRFHSSSN
jgi:hypothetical protein